MSDRSDDVPDVATAPELAARGVDVEESGGLESQILLARARQKLLGWSDTPATIGRYRVIERIGEGGMGVVFAVHDDELDRVVAIKILRSELAPGSAGRQRLVREAQATARLSHPNVVHVYEVGQQGDHVYMAMELVRGQTLRAWQTTARSWTDIVAIYRRVGEGLVAAHAESIVHRDFKPDNVLVGSEQRPQIVDFGLARASGDTGVFAEVGASSGSGPTWRDLDITGTGTVLGTPAYMAPEQLHRAKPDARSDQFSFCVALFEALYGRRPFAGSTYTQLADALDAGTTVAIADRRGVPEAVHAIVLRGLAHEPADRFAAMRELLDALELASRPRPKSARTGIAIVGVAAMAALGWALVPQAAAPTSSSAAAPAEANAIDPWAEIVAASELPPLVPTPLADDPTGVTVHRLRNGLTIYLAHRPTEPLVTVMLAIRAGAAEEGEHRGLAPLVREAVQRGTARLGVTDAVAERSLLVAQHQLIDALPNVREPAARAQLLQTIAASEQASAAYEIPAEMYEATLALGGVGAPVLGGNGAVYATRVPSNRVGAWLAMANEMVQRPVFRGFLGETAGQLEMMTVYDTDDPAGRARAPLLAAATGVQIGGEATLTSLAEVPLAAAREFHRERYRPNNTALVMIGDITAEQAIRLAEQQLGDWEPAPLPATRVVDEPFAQPRVVQDSVAPGGDAIEMVWTLPPWGTPEYAQLAQLEFVLGGSHGLLSALGGDASRGWGAFVGPSRDFMVIGFPAPGVSHDALEQATIANLRKVAEGRVDDALWDAALAEAQLERASWARGPSSLASAIAESFMSRRDWASASRSLAVVPPTRDEVMAAAKLLLARPLVVSRRTQGEAPAIAAPELPSLPNLPAQQRGRSAFVDEIVGAPVHAMEPRFLVAGSSFQTSMHGAGRVIASKNDGPLFWLTWIYPVGLAENPWACDAAHARMPAARIAGARIWVLCTSADTRVSVMAPASRFADMMPQLSQWLRADTVDVDPR
ncbi:MAG TPA: protein kinase, partial [Nannocystaceae bacterium]|nr:protein kinase [Nannocystaceae bacterium]